MGTNIATLVVPNCVLDRENPALDIDRYPGLVTLFTTLVGGYQVFLPILNPFDRPTKPPGSNQYQNVFRVKLTANSESTADMALMNMNLLGRKPEHLDEGLFIAVWDLGRTVQREDVGH